MPDCQTCRRHRDDSESHSRMVWLRAMVQTIKKKKKRTAIATQYCDKQYFIERLCYRRCSKVQPGLVR